VPRYPDDSSVVSLADRSLSSISGTSPARTRILPTQPPDSSKSGRPTLGAVLDILMHMPSGHMPETGSVRRPRLSSPPHILALLAIQFSKSVFCSQTLSDPPGLLSKSQPPQNNRCPSRPSTRLSRLGHRARKARKLQAFNAESCTAYVGYFA
jgi:hypothetical protein